MIAPGILKPCVYCARLKANQKNVSRSSQSLKAIKPDGRVYLYLSKVTVSRSNGSEFELRQNTGKVLLMRLLERSGVNSHSNKECVVNGQAHV